MSLVDDIYQVFIDYYGESRVDKQEYSSENPIVIEYEHNSNCHIGDFIILVHWPVVTVTNEYDGHIDIWDLYAATVVSPLGELRQVPTFIRSTYDRVQWNCSYLHSHVSSINKCNLHSFSRSCLGSGPINRTIGKLNGSQNSDLDIWRLYCWELDKYVAVESLAGIPYRRLQNVTAANSETNSSRKNFYMEPTISLPRNTHLLIRTFIEKLLEENILKFAYLNGAYTIASPYSDTVLQLSNFFIKLYNDTPSLRLLVSKEELFRKRIVDKKCLKDGTIYSITEGIHNIPVEAVSGAFMFHFKGTDVHLRFRDYNSNYDASEVLLLNLELVDNIIFTLLKYINIGYGKSNTISKGVKVL